MRKIQALSQEKNQINDNEKARLLHFFVNNQINHETQKYFYERGDQSSQENGAAKYINTTHDSLYEQYISKEETSILQELNVREALKDADVIFDLGPGEGQVLQHINKGLQTYRPVDVSAYVLDQIKKNKGLKLEGTINDRFSTTAFSESKGKKSYISLKNVPNLSDQEIECLLKKLTPTHEGKSKLIVSYFPDFNESKENIDILKAIYGDGNPENPYYDKSTYEKSAERIVGGFLAIGFSKEDIKFILEYDKTNHRILEGIEIINDIEIKADGQEFERKVGDKILPCQSRRVTSDHIEEIAKKAGWKVKQQKKGSWVSVAIFEKTDPNKTPNLIKTRGQRIALALGLSASVLAGYNAYQNYEKNSFLEQKQQQIQKNLLTSYTPEQITHFNQEIQQTVNILKTFYGIHDEGYINGLIRPYLLAHPELVQEIMERNGILTDNIPTQSMPDYLAMILMKDQENVNFLEYFGDDMLGYKKYDAHMPNMLTTMQYYDSIFDANRKFTITPEQEIIIRPTSKDHNSMISGLFNTEHLGKGLSYGNKETNVYLVDHYTTTDLENEVPKRLIATGEGVGSSNRSDTRTFIENYISYRHQTKYLARQVALYIKQQTRANLPENEKGREFEELTYIRNIEHILQEFVLHSGDTKPYLTTDSIGKKVFDELIRTNPKCIKYFKEHIGIDLENMQKLPEYEQRRGKSSLTRGENSAYRNDTIYKEASKNYYKRD